MTLVGICTAILTQEDKIVLSRLLPLDAFGYYTLAATLAAGLMLIVGPIVNLAFPRTNHTLTVVTGGIEEGGFADDLFDAVSVFHVIEHVHDPAALLRKCARVLRPGGLLVITTPNLHSLGHRWFRENWRGLEPPRHLHIFSSLALMELVTRAGLVARNPRTTARMTRGIWWHSQEIKHQNRGNVRSPGSSDYAAGFFFTAVEDIGRFFSPFIAEETVLMASKPCATQPAAAR